MTFVERVEVKPIDQNSKRILDLVIGLLGLVVLSPITVSIFIQIRRKLGSRVFFRQFRPGLHGESFEMVKFQQERIWEALYQECCRLLCEKGIPVPDVPGVARK